MSPDAPTLETAADGRHPARRHAEVLREHLAPAGRRVLDIGCGDGALSRFLAREGAEVVGLEISPRALRRALEHTDRPRDGTPAPRGPGPRWLCARGEALPFAPGSFDVALFFNSLHHVPVADQPAALAEAARVLKPGGLLAAIEPLAEGAGHALMLPVEDETDMRAHAVEAIAGAAARGLLEPLARETYEASYRVGSFEEWAADMIAVDPARRPAIEAELKRRGAAWKQEFLAAAAPDPPGPDGRGGFRLPSPTRLDLLRRRPATAPTQP